MTLSYRRPVMCKYPGSPTGQCPPSASPPGVELETKLSKISVLPMAVSPAVAGFAVAAETKLQADGWDNPQEWDKVSLPKLVDQLEAKAARLAAAPPDDLEAIFARAVVVGSLALMVADKAAAAKEKALLGLHLPSENDNPQTKKPPVTSVPREFKRRVRN